MAISIGYNNTPILPQIDMGRNVCTEQIQVQVEELFLSQGVL